ncbi:MAG: hypothetical protein WCI88_13435 [Chloroflexota bacterium]
MLKSCFSNNISNKSESLPQKYIDAPLENNHNRFMNKKYFSKIFQILTIIIFSISSGSIFPINSFASGSASHTWTFDSSSASDFTYDPTMITVEDTAGAHPINKISNGDFEGGTTGWSTSAVAPTGWVEVPGDPALYGTNNFLVMKYEAKCALASTPTVGLKTPTLGFGDYKDSLVGGSACTSANSKIVTSLSSGYAITTLNQSEALTRCQSVTLGTTNSHLLSNDERMTIARNIEVQDANWSLGNVGQGYLFAGHNDFAPAAALEASSIDTGNYSCAFTDLANPPAENPIGLCPTNTATTSSGTAGLQRRTHVLSNGAIIWDIAGNVLEWSSTNLTCAGTNCSSAEMPFGITPASEYLEFATGATGWAGDVLTTFGAYSWDDLGPANHTFNSDYGIGRFNSDSNAASPSGMIHSFVYGGRWSDGVNAGVYYLYLARAPFDTASGLGFRCASDFVAIFQSNNSGTGVSSSYSNRVAVGNVTPGKIYQSMNIGSTETYDIWTYVYNRTAGSVGDMVNSGVAELYANGVAITTAYTDMTATLGAGWWKLSGTVVGADESREYGLEVKTGKTVDVDNFIITEQGEKNIFTTTAYSNDKVVTWDSFNTEEYDDGTPVLYQICLDDGSVCETNDTWMYYDGDSWGTALNTTTDRNTRAELTGSAMDTLNTTNGKLSMKAIFEPDGPNLPSIQSITLGYTEDTTGPTGSVVLVSSDTTSQNVVLQFSVSDDFSDVTEMIICDNPSFTGCSYEPYSSTKAWTFSAGTGEKKVYVMFRDALGNESEVNVFTYNLTRTGDGVIYVWMIVMLLGAWVVKRSWKSKVVLQKF